MFFLHCMINILRQMNRYRWQVTDEEVFVKLINQFPHFLTKSIDRYNGLSNMRDESIFFFLQSFFWRKLHLISLFHCTKKWSFPLRISSVNVTKSAGNCGFGHIYWLSPIFCGVLFVHYSMIQLKHVCWNCFLNNFNLLDGLLRLVYLLMLYGCFTIIIVDQQNVGTFSDDTCSSTTVSYIASYGAPINIFFWTSFLFFFHRIFYVSTRFISVLTH